jgi:UDP-glucose 4-epimerase
MPVPVTGSLDRIRDFVYIDDVVRAWEHALAHPTTASPVYNIGSGTPATVRNLLDALLSVLELPRDYPIVEGVSSPGDQHAIVADVGRSWKELGWQPYVDLTTGLQKMIAWAKAQVQARV